MSLLKIAFQVIDSSKNEPKPVLFFVIRGRLSTRPSSLRVSTQHRRRLSRHSWKLSLDQFRNGKIVASDRAFNAGSRARHREPTRLFPSNTTRQASHSETLKRRFHTIVPPANQIEAEAKPVPSRSLDHHVKFASAVSHHPIRASQFLYSGKLQFGCMFCRSKLCLL